MKLGALCRFAVIFSLSIPGVAMSSTLIPTELTLVSTHAGNGADVDAGEIKGFVRSDGSDVFVNNVSAPLKRSESLFTGTIGYTFENTGDAVISFEENALSYTADAFYAFQNTPGVDAQHVRFEMDFFYQVTEVAGQGNSRVFQNEVFYTEVNGTRIIGRSDDLRVADFSSVKFRDFDFNEVDPSTDLSSVGIGSDTGSRSDGVANIDTTLSSGAFSIAPGQFLSVSATMNLFAAAQSFELLPTGYEDAAVLNALSTGSLTVNLPNTVSFISTGTTNVTFVTGGLQLTQPTPVPLPASSFLLIGALFALHSLRRRGHVSAAA